MNIFKRNSDDEGRSFWISLVMSWKFWAVLILLIIGWTLYRYVFLMSITGGIQGFVLAFFALAIGLLIGYSWGFYKGRYGKAKEAEDSK